MAKEPFHSSDFTTCDEDAVLVWLSKGGVRHLNARLAPESPCDISSRLLGMEDIRSFGKLRDGVEELTVGVSTKVTGPVAGGCVIEIKDSVSFGAMADEVMGLGVRLDLGCIDIDCSSMPFP
ncbi:hypothetical protein AFCA_012916 [Aspergillus flavus]|nr:hypothetical protein AFCA_012916 [Aspergillus flavus]